MNPQTTQKTVTPPNDRFQAGRVLSVSAGHAVHDTYTAFLPPLLPIFISTLSLSNVEAGMLHMFAQAPSLFQPLMGHFMDRPNRLHLVFLAPAITAAFMSLLGVAPNFGVLALLLVLSGFSSAALHAVGPVIAGRLSGKALGRGMSIWMLGGELGRTLGPITVVTVLRFMTMGQLPWLMIVGFLASMVLYIRIRDESKGPSTHQEGLPWRQAIRGMRRFMMPIAGLIIVRGFMFGALTIFLPTYLASQGKSLWLAGASLTIVQAAGAAGAFFGGTLSDRIGRRWVLFITILTTPILMLIFLGTDGWIQFPLLIGMGLMLISTTPVIMALVQENFPENRALANGIYMCLSFALRSAVIVGVGALGDWLGLKNAFIISSVVMLFGLPLILFLPKDKQQSHTEPAPIPEME